MLRDFTPLKRVTCIASNLNFPAEKNHNAKNGDSRNETKKLLSELRHIFNK